MTQTSKLNKNKRRRQRNREFVNQYKTGKQCPYCAESNPVCLEFHHIDKSTKDSNVSRMVYTSGISRIKREISKCELICLNCHRKLHSNEVLNNL
jgi:transcription elongation factor Elf1